MGCEGIKSHFAVGLKVICFVYCCQVGQRVLNDLGIKESGHFISVIMHIIVLGC